MELKDFIRDTIVQIQTGVEEARALLHDKVPGVINPVWGSADSISRQDIRNIDFDIAVTVDNSASASVTGKSSGLVKVLAVDIDANGEISRGKSSVSRVCFSIPYIPPATIVTKNSSPISDNKTNQLARK